MPLFKQITIVGVGLIGGSLAKVIRKKGLSKKIVGFFRNKQRLNLALKEKIVDQGHLDLKKSIKGSDLVILALPISQIINFMLKIKKISPQKTIIMDVGSTKFNITKIADKLKLNFVGTHPLAGSEKRGMDFSSSNLFANSKVIITPTVNTSQETIKKIRAFWKKLNADVITLPAKQHDKILSYTSHLPHLTAFCLISSIPQKYLKFAASGLKDTTRIALSDAQIWSDIFSSNRKEVLHSLNSLERQMRKLKKILNSNKKNQLFSLLNKSKNRRQKIE